VPEGQQLTFQLGFQTIPARQSTAL
jgi:hypothetical protein